MNHEVFKSNRRANMTQDDYYLSPDGYIIFTEKYHLKRGYCCKSSCKHCPYGFDKKTENLKPKG